MKKLLLLITILSAATFTYAGDDKAAADKAKCDAKCDKPCCKDAKACADAKDCKAEAKDCKTVCTDKPAAQPAATTAPKQ